MFKTVSFILFGLATSALISAASLPPFDSTNAATAVAVDADMPVFKSQLKIKGVGYSNIIDNQLVLSTFDGTPIFGKDAVFTIPEPSMLMFATHKVSPKKMEGAVVTWPNAVSAASASLFGKEGMLVPGG